MRKTRKFSRKRACLVLLIINIALLIVISAVSCSIRRRPVGWEAYTVVEGDTLWGIAARSNGAGRLNRGDIVDDMVAHGEKTLIYPGETVYIPVYREVGR